jgi:thiosulfate/3-mercaptopyruvate sulfurtransferase
MAVRLIVAILLAGYAAESGANGGRVQLMAPAAGGLLISAEELAAAKDPSIVILYVEDRSGTFEEAHIPGARPVRYLDFAVDGGQDLGSELPSADEARRVFEAAGVSNSSRVVLYGSSPVTAARAFFTLDALGHTRVALLDGGLRAWRAGGRPIETGPAKPASPGRFTPVLIPEKVASAQHIQQHMNRNGIAGMALVDVRPDAEFLGTDGGMRGAHAAGHIPGARQLPWNALVQEDGRFLPRAELQAKLAAAGATPGKPVVSYCMVGMRASVVYFVARHLGYDARLYDGSIVDWSQRKLPVVTGRH